MHLHFQLVQQCIQISTRINSSSVHTYILVCFIRNYIPATFSNGLLTNNSTWCQNRGCICISSTRRTYGRIHMHTAYIQTSTIILQTELFPKKRREKIQGEIFQSSSSTVSIHSTCNPASFQSSRAKTTILHTELIPPQEISKKYYNYKAHPVQTNTRHLSVTVPVHPSILHGRIRLPAPLQHSRPTRHKQASS